MDSRSHKAISLQECSTLLSKVDQSIKDLIYKFGYEGDNILYDRENMDEEFLRSQYVYLFDKLKDVHQRIKYLSLPVLEQGVISHNDSGRYKLPSGTYFTSGSTCEILYQNRDEQYWMFTTIEHTGEDYYATALGKNVSINGMIVRIRG